MGDGSPNLSPEGSVLVYDDHLVFTHMASPATLANLRQDPRVEINVVDFLKRRGYRFKGTAQFRHESDPAYEWARQWAVDTHGPQYPCREAVLIRVDRALAVDSPAYMFGHATEDSLVQFWSGPYGLNRPPPA